MCHPELARDVGATRFILSEAKNLDASPLHPEILSEAKNLDASPLHPERSEGSRCIPASS
jgi:hypothetical protein